MLSSHVSYLNHKKRDALRDMKKTKNHLDNAKQLDSLIMNHETRIMQIDGVVSVHYTACYYCLAKRVFRSHPWYFGLGFPLQINATHSLQIWSDSTKQTIKILTDKVSAEMLEKIQDELHDNLEDLGEALAVFEAPEQLDEEEFAAEFEAIGGDISGIESYLGDIDLPSAPNEAIRSTTDRRSDLVRANTVHSDDKVFSF